MRIKFTHKCLLFVAGFMSVAAILFAQIPDRQVIEMMKQYQNDGWNQEEAYTELVTKGVTNEQLMRIKMQLSATQNSASKSEGRVDLERSRDGSDVGGVATQSTASRASMVFGRDFFTNKNLTFAPNLNLPTPERYKLGVGDEVIVDIWGDSELSVRGKISPDGNINVSGLGPIYLNGLQISEASEKLKRSFAKIYSDIQSPSPRTFFRVTLGNIKSIQVNLMGEISVPGTYVLSSFATVFHALYVAGGVNNIGTLRNIKVYRKGKLFSTVDVYEYLMQGKSSDDVMLEDGDVVMVGAYSKLVTIAGNVKRPMVYEMKGDESVATIITYAGGFRGDAYKKNLKMTRKGESEMKILTVNAEDFAAITLVDGDVLSVGAILDKYENKVEVQGAVFRPGAYAIESGMTSVKNLIGKAEGLRGDAYLELVLLYRQNEDLTTSVEALNLRDIVNGAVADVALRRNDLLVVSSILNMEAGRTITVNGHVRAAGTFSFVAQMSLSDAIIQAGGFSEAASTARIDVARRIVNPSSIKESELQAMTFSFALSNGLIAGADGFMLEPFDVVSVRRSPGYEAQQNVVIQGEILFGGAYAKTHANERLSEVVKRAGGLTKNAYTKGAKLFRKLNEEERFKAEKAIRMNLVDTRDSVAIDRLNIGEVYMVGIDLEAAMANPNSGEDLVLREGDQIIIPTMENTIKVAGAVSYPNTMSYSEKLSLSDIIERSGGYAYRAKKSGIFIVYMNGMVRKKRGNRASQIQPGCEIIVPLKHSKRGSTVSLAEMLSVATSTTSMAALITQALK